MLSMTPWLLLLAVFVASIHCHPIAPGKYSQDRVLDYFHISVSEDADIRIKYHDHLLKPGNCKFLPSGELLQFELKRDDQGHLRGSHHDSTPSTFKSIDDTHRLEVYGDRELLWTRESPDEVKNQLVEIAMIQNPNNRSDAFIREAFSPSRTPPVFYWDGVYGISKCPTTQTKTDKDHSATKVIGTTMAHIRIWQDFYWRHRSNDEGQRILILESDVHCSREFCGDIAIELINRTDKDLLFIGWCVFNDSRRCPLCLHAYFISVRAARILSTDVFPCVNAGDEQISAMGNSGVLTWATVDTGKNRVKLRTDGLILQDW